MIMKAYFGVGDGTIVVTELLLFFFKIGGLLVLSPLEEDLLFGSALS